jgi:hypothetical protein
MSIVAVLPASVPSSNAALSPATMVWCRDGRERDRTLREAVPSVMANTVGRFAATVARTSADGHLHAVADDLALSS